MLGNDKVKNILGEGFNTAPLNKKLLSLLSKSAESFLREIVQATFTESSNSRVNKLNEKCLYNVIRKDYRLDFLRDTEGIFENPKIGSKNKRKISTKSKININQTKMSNTVNSALFKNIDKDFSNKVLEEVEKKKEVILSQDKQIDIEEAISEPTPIVLETTTSINTSVKKKQNLFNFFKKSN